MWYSSDRWITGYVLSSPEDRLQEASKCAEKLDAVTPRHGENKACCEWLGSNQFLSDNRSFLRSISELFVKLCPNHLKFALSRIESKVYFLPLAFGEKLRKLREFF